MPKYYDFKICGYYLYFTAHCIIECMHVHASDPCPAGRSDANISV